MAIGRIHITYGFHTTPFGECIVGIANGQLCHLSFSNFTQLKEEWPDASFEENPNKTKSIIDNFFALKFNPQLKLFLKGTNFQVKVWKALTKIPFGQTVSYESIAHNIGQPTATRAVASAIAKNSISLIVPCHRVISKSGKPHKYRWGASRKKAILEWEAAMLP